MGLHSKNPGGIEIDIDVDVKDDLTPLNICPFRISPHQWNEYLLQDMHVDAPVCTCLHTYGHMSKPRQVAPMQGDLDTTCFRCCKVRIRTWLGSIAGGSEPVL